MVDLTTGFIVILLIHFVSDFVLQSTNMAQNKSSSNKWLATHVVVYTLPFFLMVFLFRDIQATLLFMLINGVAHFATDYVTSRINKRYWAQEKWHQFFVTVGADQTIHLITLLLTFKWLSGV